LVGSVNCDVQLGIVFAFLETTPVADGCASNRGPPIWSPFRDVRPAADEGATEAARRAPAANAAAIQAQVTGRRLVTMVLLDSAGLRDEHGAT
jgi:hypothetical protein